MKLYEPRYPKSSSLLRIARMHREMSQVELAEETGISQVTISHLESGRPLKKKTRPRRPHPSTQKLLAMALDYEPSDLFPEEGKRSTSKELRILLAKDQKKRKARDE